MRTISNTVNIFGQRYSTSGRLGTVFHINAPGGSANEKPFVSRTAEGFVVVWQSNNNIYARRYTSAGVAIGVEFRLNTTEVTGNYGYAIVNNAAAAGLQGGYVVIARATVDGQFDRAGSEFRVNTFQGTDQFLPAAAAFQDGRFIITWVSNSQDGSGNGIYGQRFSSLGNRIRREFRINSFSFGHQNNPMVATFEDGGFVVVWETYDANDHDGWGSGIFGQLFDISARRQGREFLINTTTCEDRYNPYVVCLKNGDFIVSWESDKQAPDNSWFGIFAQLLRERGARRQGVHRQSNDAGKPDQLVYRGTGRRRLCHHVGF